MCRIYIVGVYHQKSEILKTVVPRSKIKSNFMIHFSKIFREDCLFVSDSIQVKVSSEQDTS